MVNRSGESCMRLFEEGLRDHANAGLRNASMDAFRLAGRKALPSLLKLLSDPDEEVRLFAANLLGDIGHERACGPLMAALSDPDLNVKAASAEALGKIGHQGAVAALSAVIGEEEWLSIAAIDALAAIGGKDAEAVLCTCIGQGLYLDMTFDAMERTGDPKGLHLLTPFIEKKETRELALKAVVNIAGKGNARLRPEYFCNMVPLLIELVADSAGDLKKSALLALSWAEDARGVFSLIDSLSDEALQEYAIDGLIRLGKKGEQAIIDSIRDASCGGRVLLTKILSLMGEYEALLQFAYDPEPEVRVEAALAAGCVNSKKAASVAARLLDDPDEEVRAAAKVSQSKKGEWDAEF